LTAFERRQQILKLLQRQGSVQVNELAGRLAVSRVTIRHDLEALEEEGALTRVRGGAVLPEDYRAHSPTFAARAQVNASAKDRIARWAADMIQEGEVVLVDASTTVFHMLPYLMRIRNLTVITTSLEMAAALAKDPSHTTILIGGELSPTGASVRGHLAKQNLAQLHARTAFISCSGFTVQEGLMQADIKEAELGESMIRAAERVVALIDSSKFGRRDLASFVPISRVAHILTDGDLAPAFVEELRAAGVAFTVCGEETVSSYTPLDRAKTHYKIGFANISEETSAFALEVRRGLEAAAQKAGDIDLIFADNQLSGEVAISVADRLIEEGVDLAIEYQIDEKVGAIIANKFQQADIPVIAVDIPMLGATFFGVDNYRAGKMAGVALGKWLQQHWHGELDRLVVLQEPRAGPLPAARIQGQLDGLREVAGEIPADKVIYLDSGHLSEVTEKQMAAVLEGLPGARRLAVISFNDRATIGALNAARQAGRESDVILLGQGADRSVREELRRPGSRLVGATAYWPERYGAKLVDIALRLLRGERVPPAVYIDHVFINADNIAEYYPE